MAHTVQSEMKHRMHIQHVLQDGGLAHTVQCERKHWHHISKSVTWCLMPSIVGLADNAHTTRMVGLAGTVQSDIKYRMHGHCVP